METLLDKPAAAERLGTTKRHIEDLVTRREIPFVRVGRLIRFKPADLDAWVQANRTEATD